MRKTLILLVVLAILAAPIVTSSLPATAGYEVVLAADPGDDAADADTMSWWDWLVHWWTTHTDQWPD